MRTFTENMSCHFHSHFLRRSKSDLTYSTMCQCSLVLRNTLSVLGFNFLGFTLHLDCTSTPHIFLTHYIADQKDLHFCLIFVPYVRLSLCAFFFILGYTLFSYRPTSRQNRSTSNENAREYIPNGDILFHEGCFAGSWRDIC